MNLSGILVVVEPAKLPDTIQKLEALPGVDVHHTDPANGRIVVVQEAPTVREEVAGLERIKSLPDIVLAEMVQHRFDEDRETDQSIPENLEDGLPQVPSFLDD